MAMPTINDLMNYSGIDYADAMATSNLERALASAVKLVEGAIGEDVATVLADDSRVTDLVLIYADDLYTHRGLFNTDNAKVSGATRRMVNDLETQVRMEYRRLKGV